jgi:excisionase family DNA binding protein
MTNGVRLLLTMAEACERLGCSRKTLMGEVRSGALRYILLGKARRFSERDLEEWMERKRVAWPEQQRLPKPGGKARPPRGVLSFAEAQARAKWTPPRA